MNLNLAYSNSESNLIQHPVMTAKTNNKNTLSIFPQEIAQPACDMHLRVINNIGGYSLYEHFPISPRQHLINPFTLYTSNEASELCQIRAHSHGNHPANISSFREPPVYITPEDSNHNMIQSSIGLDNYKKQESMLRSIRKTQQVCSSHSGGRQKRAKNWEERLEMLIQFKNEHGHCMVPQNHPFLGSWVKWQREKYALCEKGKNINFTSKQIDALNELGFVWRVRRKREKSSSNDVGDMKPSFEEQSAQKRRR